MGTVTVRIAAALLAGLSAWIAAQALIRRTAGSEALSGAGERVHSWRQLARGALDEGRIDSSFGDRRLLLAVIAVGAVLGGSLLGLVGVPLGVVLTPLALRQVVRARRERYAGRIDAGAAELAQALASSLSAGRSVRGALLTASVATPEPLSAELERVAVDLTLGRSVTDALAAMRWRTDSARIESLSGAIELHRGSGGDLVQLMRELADAFRARDRARHDARTATAQARYTALVVAAIPVFVCVAIELSSPGMVTGTFTLLPTAVMMIAALALLIGGVLLSHRVARA